MLHETASFTFTILLEMKYTIEILLVSFFVVFDKKDEKDGLVGLAW